MSRSLGAAFRRRVVKLADRVAESMILHLGSGRVSSRVKYWALRCAGARVEWPVMIDAGVWVRQPHLFKSGGGLVLSRGVVLNCSVEMSFGRECLIGYGAYIGTAAHRIPDDVDESILRAGHDHLPVSLGDGTWIGAHACVLPGVNLGNGSVVGAGAVVTKSLPAGSVAVGVPARVVRVRGAYSGHAVAVGDPVG